MHEGCTGTNGDGLEVLQKIRMMGFNDKPMPEVLEFNCHECDGLIEMATLEYKCPTCHMVYAVTPCSATDVTKIKAAGVSV